MSGWKLPVQAEADNQVAQAEEARREADALRQRAEAHAAQLRSQLTTLQVSCCPLDPKGDITGGCRTGLSALDGRCKSHSLQMWV